MSQRMLVLVGSFAIVGCSTTNNTTVVEPKCGAGTELVEGVCVATAADASAEDANTTDSAASSDSSAGDDGPRDTGSVALDAPPDTVAAGDPCPTKAADVNCSSTCAGGGTTMVNCSKVKCGTAFADTLRVKETDLPFVMRTPSNPGKDPACAASTCLASSALAYGMFVRTTFLGGSYFRARVAPPWKFYDHTGGDIFCPEAARDLGQCLVAGSTDILVGTTDPNAVSRNVIFESVPFGTTCP